MELPENKLGYLFFKARETLIAWERLVTVSQKLPPLKRRH
ncbi:hypothetical protein NBRC111894_474 [Sporolactobacillus inulinus]|uniref:Uncharacterized protein n=1 Tax=Sporolactobacillus inulinus TaxID=2078 RepID=A0A4Y1Z7C0_9BACL|nr:hypothetical protein NBRC111894_474 [Sporolactobacillus inulinus]